MKKGVAQAEDGPRGVLHGGPADAQGLRDDEAFAFGQALRLLDNLLSERPGADHEAGAFLAKHDFRRLCR